MTHPYTDDERKHFALLERAMRLGVPMANVHLMTPLPDNDDAPTRCEMGACGHRDHREATNSHGDLETWHWWS